MKGKSIPMRNLTVSNDIHLNMGMMMTMKEAKKILKNKDLPIEIQCM
jgi:hypothetical protein